MTSRPAHAPSPAAAPWGTVVLAGGTSRRWGGRDKTAALLAGVPVLLHAAGCALTNGCSALVLVAPADHPARTALAEAARSASCPLTWTREQPPGGGPLAGLAAGVAALDLPLLVLLAGDLPFAGPAVPRLLAALALAGAPDHSGDPCGGPVDAALGVDPDGRRQPLLAAYRTAALRPSLAGEVADLPLRAVLAGLRVVEVPVGEREAFDLDTPQRLADAERLLTANPPQAGDVK